MDTLTTMRTDVNGIGRDQLISQLDREQLLRESAAKDAKIAQLEAFQFNTALAAGNAQQTRNEMQGQTALILAALRDRTPASSGGASA
jgi:hypothetical protein